jgi:hypothetical protein
MDVEKALRSISDAVGEYSLQMVALITFFALMPNPTLALLFLAGLIINILLNRWLKHVVFKKFNQKTGNNFPSGHFQIISYCVLIYTLFVSKKRVLAYSLYFIIAGCTFYNCIHYKYHTYLDMIGGIFAGTIVGVSLVHLYNFLF